MYTITIYDTQWWSNEDLCWRFRMLTWHQLQEVLSNPHNERVHYVKKNLEGCAQ